MLTSHRRRPLPYKRQTALACAGATGDEHLLVRIESHKRPHSGAREVLNPTPPPTHVRVGGGVEIDIRADGPHNLRERPLALHQNPRPTSIHEPKQRTVDAVEIIGPDQLLRLHLGRPGITRKPTGIHEGNRCVHLDPGLALNEPPQEIAHRITILRHLRGWVGAVVLIPSGPLARHDPEREILYLDDADTMSRMSHANVDLNGRVLRHMHCRHDDPLARGDVHQSLHHPELRFEKSLQIEIRWKHSPHQSIIAKLKCAFRRSTSGHHQSCSTKASTHRGNPPLHR